MSRFVVPRVNTTAEADLGWRKHGAGPKGPMDRNDPSPKGPQRRFQSGALDPFSPSPSYAGSPLPSQSLGAAAGLLPPRRWVAPPSNVWKGTSSSTTADRSVRGKAGLLRGGLTYPDDGPAFVAAVVGALFHDSELRAAVHEGLAMLHDLQSGTPPTQMTIARDDDIAAEWFAKARQAQLESSTKGVLAAIDAWITWPGSRKITGDVYANVAVNELAIAAACDATRHPLPHFEIPEFRRVEAGQEANDTHIKSNPAAFAICVLAAAMAELQYARRTTAALRRLIPVGQTLSSTLGEDAIFRHVAGRRRCVKQCTLCGCKSTDYVPYLGLQIDTPADLRRRAEAMAGRGRERVVSAIPLEAAIDLSLHTTNMVRSQCNACLRVTEHRADEEPGPWPARLLLVLLPDVKMNAVDCIRVTSKLDLPDRLTSSSGVCTFELRAAVVQHRMATATNSSFRSPPSENFQQQLRSTDPLEPLAYLRESPPDDVSVGAARSDDTWWRASAISGVAVVSESEVLGECSTAGRLLIFERHTPDAERAHRGAAEPLTL